MSKIGYLGPPGTFTEEALLKMGPAESDKLVQYGNIPDILHAVESGEVDEGIVPIENSIEGSVNVTLDMLIFQVDLMIDREIVVNVDHNLLTGKGVDISQIQTIYSHPHALAQCRTFIKERFGNIEVKAANSTAEAAKIARESDGRTAAIATKLAAELYDLDILATDIQEFKQNVTRFVLVGKNIGARSGLDKTSIVCFIYEDRPGSLLEILQEIADRNINLTKIESRPTKKSLGEYCFLLDMEGHVDDSNIAGALESLKSKLRHVKILGSFPRWREND